MGISPNARYLIIDIYLNVFRVLVYLGPYSLCLGQYSQDIFVFRIFHKCDYCCNELLCETEEYMSSLTAI